MVNRNDPSDVLFWPDVFYFYTFDWKVLLASVNFVCTYGLFDDFENGLLDVTRVLDVDFTQSRKECWVFGQKAGEEGRTQLLVFFGPGVVIQLSSSAELVAEEPSRRLHWVIQ